MINIFNIRDLTTIILKRISAADYKSLRLCDKSITQALYMDKPHRINALLTVLLQDDKFTNSQIFHSISLRQMRKFVPKKARIVLMTQLPTIEYIRELSKHWMIPYGYEIYEINLNWRVAIWQYLSRNPRITTTYIRENWVFFEYLIGRSLLTYTIISEHWIIDYFDLIPPSLLIKCEEGRVELHDREIIQILLQTPDLIRLIASDIRNGREYKAIIFTCKLWHDLIASPSAAHAHMNIISTLIMQHPEIAWDIKSMQNNVTSHVINKYRSDVDFKSLTWEHMNISFINKCLKKGIHNRNILNFKLDSKFLEKHAAILKQYYKQSNAILPYTADMIFTYNVPHYRLFSKSIYGVVHISSYIANNVHDADMWSFISANPNLTPEFIRVYKAQLDWEQLSKNRALTMPLIHEFIDKINWYYIGENPNLTSDFILEYSFNFRVNIVEHPCVDMKTLTELLKIPKFDSILVSKNPNLTQEFILERSWGITILNILDNQLITLEQAETIYWDMIINNCVKPIGFK